MDTAPEFRIQAVKNHIRRLDSIFYTHDHADHLFGFDDIRAFNHRQKGDIPCYGNARTVSTIRRLYSYAFKETQQGGGKPRVAIRRLELHQGVEFSGLRVSPLPVMHGRLAIYGYHFQLRGGGSLAYLTDCSFIPDFTMERLSGVDLVIVGTPRYRPHATHFSVDEACAVVRRVGVERTYLTHISHDLEHRRLSSELPPGVAPAHDGLRLEI